MGNGNTWCVLVSGGRIDDELDTWRRAAAERERARERERGESAPPGQPRGPGAIGEGEHDWRPVVAHSSRVLFGRAWALAERSRTGLLLGLSFFFSPFGSWAVPFSRSISFTVSFFSKPFISFLSSSKKILF